MGIVESLKVYRRGSADAGYTDIYDFQWVEPNGAQAGLRCAVKRNHGLHGDYFRKIEPFGTLALRRIGDDETEFRAELRIGGRAYELPITVADQ